MSNWSDFCDDLIDDLTVEVSGLRDVLVHRYVPWDPEELSAEAGDRHLSVFPVGESAASGDPMTTMGTQVTEAYRILYWESAGDESARGIADTDAAADVLDLAQSVRDRIQTVAASSFGGVFNTRYLGTAFPDRSGAVRWFAVAVEARRGIDIT